MMPRCCGLQADEWSERVARLEASRPAPARTAGAYMNTGFSVAMDGGWSTDPDPAERLERGDHDPQQRGFSLRNAELTLDGAVDPYLQGFGNIALKVDEENETEIELEEAYLLTTALPGGLQLKAGQFFAEFGRQNTQHPHAWAFVDQPLALNRAFGGEGLRNVGARVSWLAPTPFYTEILLGVFNGAGGTAYSFRNEEADFHGRAPVERGLGDAGDLLYVPRVASSFELTPEQTLVVGASGAFGPNSTGSDASTQIYGAFDDETVARGGPRARVAQPHVPAQRVLQAAAAVQLGRPGRGRHRAFRLAAGGIRPGRARGPHVLTSG